MLAMYAWNGTNFQKKKKVLIAIW